MSRDATLPPTRAAVLTSYRILADLHPPGVRVVRGLTLRWALPSTTATSAPAVSRSRTGIAPAVTRRSSVTALVAVTFTVPFGFGRVSAAHPGLRVVVREPSSTALSTARIARLGDGLRQNGVA